MNKFLFFGMPYVEQMKLTNTKDLPLLGVSHNPDIKKKVFIERNVIPRLMMFGEATFEPGQSVDEHSHETMYEVFYITSGQAIFTVNGEDIVVKEGDCITIEEKEVHSQSNPYNNSVTWHYFGIATD